MPLEFPNFGVLHFNIFFFLGSYYNNLIPKKSILFFLGYSKFRL